jgi:hypothetical protein
MSWSVIANKKVQKHVEQLPGRFKDALALLVADIKESGPVLGNWPNYSKLGPLRHHCHIKKGRPTYVAVWEEYENNFISWR